MARSLALVLALLPAFLAAPAVAETPIFADGFDVDARCIAGSGVRVAIGVGPAERATTLGTANVFAVEIRSCGYAGNVTLGTIGLPTGWTASYPQTLITLFDGEVRSTTLTVNVPGNAIAGPEPFAATATITAIEVASSDLLLDVENVIVVRETAGSGNAPHLHVPSSVRVKAGATIRFRNEDSVSHVLHGSGIIPHEDISGAGGQPGRVVTVVTTTPGANGAYYCHSHGPNPGTTNVIVE